MYGIGRLEREKRKREQKARERHASEKLRRTNCMHAQPTLREEASIVPAIEDLFLPFEVLNQREKEEKRKAKKKKTCNTSNMTERSG